MESSLGAKKASSNASFLKNRLMVFVNCQVENPDFDNQSKDFLTSTNTVTLDDCKLPKSFLNNAVKRLGLVDDMLQDILMREKRKLLRAATTKTVRSSVSTLHRQLCLSVCLPSCLCVCLSVCLCVCLHACLSVCLCVCQFVCSLNRHFNRVLPALHPTTRILSSSNCTLNQALTHSLHHLHLL